MLLLNKRDILEAASPAEVMEAVEKAVILYETKDFSMPPRMHLDYGDDVLLLMPCFVKEGFGTKLVTVFPGNTRRGRPVTDGLMVLNHPETGEPVALLNGQMLTALRTGAVGGVALRHLAKSGACRLGIIGAGGQGFYQAIFGAHARDVQEIHIFSRKPAKVDSFIQALSAELPRVKLVAASSVETLLEAVDMVITATTSPEPVLPDRPELLKGKLFVGIGSFRPHMREYPKALFSLVEQVIVDTGHALQETGDLVVPLREGWLAKDRVITLGPFIRNEKKMDLGDTVFFKSVGMALFDLTVAQLIYQKALHLGLGQKTEF